MGRTALIAVLVALVSPGCLVLKSQHDQLQTRVATLETQTEEQQKVLQESIQRADELTNVLDGKLAEAEELLRRNQADLGMRVDQVELEVAQLRGLVENAEYVATASTQELAELRSDLDSRLLALEEKLNEATNVPEDKEGLFAEAERQFKNKSYGLARRLWRMYQSRYPQDDRLPEVKFQIGLTYFSERDYKSSLGEFYKVIQESPKSAVVPDALYYSGLAFAKLGQCKNALAYFEALQKKKTRAPDRYRDAARKQIQILEKDQGELCLDRGDANAGAAAEQSVSKSAPTE